VSDKAVSTINISAAKNLSRIKNKDRWYNNSYKRSLMILLIPGLVFMILFKYLPMLGLSIAFLDYRIMKGPFGSEWVGLVNFKRLLDGRNFINVLRNTFIISGAKLLFGFPVPIIFAILLNEIKVTRFKRIVQSVSYLPHFLSWIVVAGFCFALLSPSTGVVNNLIELLGFKPIFFMADPSVFRGVLVSSYIWKSMGWSSIIYLAALASADIEIYEAAIIDGVSRWQKIWYLVIPSLIPVISILLILDVSRIMNAGFDQVFNMYSIKVQDVSEILDTYVYDLGIKQADYSFATSVGLFKSLVNLVFVLTANQIIRKLNGRDNSVL